MDLEVISHYEDIKSVRGQLRRDNRASHRETVWLVAGEKITTIVNKDPYKFQSWGSLRIWSGGKWETLFTSSRDAVMDWTTWEVEDHLLFCYGRFSNNPFTSFDSEGALCDGGHIDC